jgi:hypothetical protein
VCTVLLLVVVQCYIYIYVHSIIVIFPRARLHSSVAGTSVDRHRKRTDKRAMKVEQLSSIVKQYGSIPDKEYIAAIVSHYNDSG